MTRQMDSQRNKRSKDTGKTDGTWKNSHQPSQGDHPTPQHAHGGHGGGFLSGNTTVTHSGGHTNYGSTLSGGDAPAASSSLIGSSTQIPFDQASHTASIPRSVGFDDTGCIHYGDVPVCDHNECLSDEEVKRKDSRKLLIIVTSLCFFFMCVEVVGGYLSNSLAIMTDAAHLLSDLVAFIVSLVSISLAQRKPTSTMTFGYHRAEIIGALLSVAIIWFLTIIIVYEAIQRIITPQEVNGKLMFIVATIGALVNLSMGSVLIFFGDGHGHSHGGASHGHSHSHGGAHDEHSDDDTSDDDSHGDVEHGHSHSHGHGHSHSHSHSHEDSPLLATGTSKKPKKSKKKKHWLDGIVKTDTINVRAAFLHVLGDLVFSIGVMIAALVVWFNPTWRIADPLCTLFFSVIVIHTTFQITKQGISVLMEGTPEHIDADAITKALHRVDGVLGIHDLHVWSLTLDTPALSVHVVCKSHEESHDVLERTSKLLREKFNLKQTTIQVEYLDDSGRFCTTWDAVPRVCKRDLSPHNEILGISHGGHGHSH